MWNTGFRWNQQKEQEKKTDLMRIINNSRTANYDGIENYLDIAEYFIEMLCKNQQIKKEDIVEGLCRRWDYIMMEKVAGLHGEQAVQKKDAAPEAFHAGRARETDKYKRKDENTINKVRELLFEGKNYSEIARALHIDRRTVKKIAVKHGLADG